MAIALPKSELSYVGPVREEQRTPIDLALERQWIKFQLRLCNHQSLDDLDGRGPRLPGDTLDRQRPIGAVELCSAVRHAQRDRGIRSKCAHPKTMKWSTF